MPYLIVNADDFGLTRGVTDAIVQAYRDGVLTSTTLMVGMPAAAYAMEQARQVPGLGVGLHLNLTAGRPVLPPQAVPSLVGPDGRFVKNFNRLAFRARHAEVRAEWEAQIQAIMALGRKPSHLDSHHNVHVYPPFTRIALDLARQYGIGAVRVTRPEDSPWGGRYRGVGPLEWTYNRLLARHSQLVDSSGLGAPAHMVGYLQDAQALDEERALGVVDGLPKGVAELVAHPGRVDDDLRAVTSLLERRQVELDTLLSPRLKQRIHERGVKLVSFNALQHTEVILTAPLTGRAVPLEQVPDPVFAQKMVGDGAAVEVGVNGQAQLVAPCAGTVTLVHSAGHGVGISTPEGLELLLHVGLDTVEMEGRGFQPLVSADEKVKPGQPLVRFDTGLIAREGHSLVSPVVVTNPERLDSLELVASGAVEAGRTPLLKLRVKPA